MSSNQNITTNFRDSNGVDLGSKLITKDYLISVYPEISQKIGISPELWVWGLNDSSGLLGINSTFTSSVSTPITTFVGGTGWKQISGTISTWSNIAAIKTDGTLWTWGRYATSVNFSGYAIGTASVPTTVYSSSSDWKQVSCTGSGIVAIKTDGTLWVAGGSDFTVPKNTSIGSTSLITTKYTSGKWKQISSSSACVAAIKDDGTLWTWGTSNLGRPTPSEGISTPITTFAGGTNWADATTSEPEDLYTLHISSQRASAIKTDGTLWTWGNGTYYLGLGDDNEFRYTPVTTIAGGTNWKQVSNGYIHTAAIKTDGTLWVWGGIKSTPSAIGILDTYSNTPVTTFSGGNNWSYAPILNPDGVNTSTLSSGSTYNFAIKTDGTLWGWGTANGGRLGNLITSTFTNSTPVTTFAGGTNWNTVYSGYFFSLATKTDGTLWGWGGGTDGVLGNLSTNIAASPITTFSGGNDWKSVSAGGSFSSAIKTDGTLWTWGNGAGGALGRFVPFISISTLTPVTTLTGGNNWADTPTTEPEDLYTLSAGYRNNVAIKTDGTLWVWGNSNSDGQLGTNNTNVAYTPVTTFAGGTDWKQVSNGSLAVPISFGTAMFAIKTNGTLWAWGNSLSGRLGNGLISGLISTPITTFAGGTNWKQISSKYNHAAAIKTDGTLWVWGIGAQGRLGNASTASTDTSTPVTTFAGGNDWKHVSTGRFHTAAIKTDGTLWVWGNNSSLQLGNNSNALVSTPVTTFAGGSNWKQVDGGYRHTAAVKTDGTLWIWGVNSAGEVGDATTVNKSTPVTTFAGGTDWKQVSCGGDSGGQGSRTLAVKTDGTLWAWGNSSNGILGNNNSGGTIFSTPVTTFAGGTSWKQVSAGSKHTIALFDDGVNKQVYLFGTTGALGIFLPEFNPKTTFAGGADWKQISSGRTHSAAIKTDGTLWTWGSGYGGMLGINTTSNITRSTPVTTFAGGTNWRQVSAGGYLTAAVKTDGTLWVWGNNTDGRLGTGLTTSSRGTPVTTFAGGTDWDQVSVGRFNTAAIKTNGTLWVWGNGVSGRLGNLGVTSRSTPITTFAGGTNWKQVNAGYTGIAAVSDDGVNKVLYTFGEIVTLGVGSIQFKNPSAIDNNTNWKHVAASDLNTAAVKTDGTLWIWGSPLDGTLGNNTTSGGSATPITTFSGGTNWKQISLGVCRTAAGIKTDGTLWVWGNGTAGRLGDNSNVNVRTPITTFAGGTNWKQVSVGFRGCAAIKTDGTLWTWGNGLSGHLGNALTSFTNQSLTPVTTFAGGTDWKQVSCGSVHVMAVKTDGTLWGWGAADFGVLGNASTIGSYTPITTFIGGTNWKQVTCGQSNTIALNDDGVNKRLYVFGRNLYLNGNLNSVNYNYLPATTFAGGTNWKQVSAANSHMGAIKNDGTLWTWGNNSSGSIGDGKVLLFPNKVETPVTTFSGGTNWKQVNCQGYVTSAIKTDGTLWTWGYSGSGNLGSYFSVLPRDISTPVTTFAGGNTWKDTENQLAEELYTIGTTTGFSRNNNYVSGALKTDGTLWLWGEDSTGATGTNTNLAAFVKYLTPVTTFAGGNNWRTVSIGSFNTAGIKTDGTLWIWGTAYDGRLGANNSGDIFPNNIATPITTFAGGNDWRSVETGYSVNAAIKTNGTLWLWGYNVNGQTGNATIGVINTPVTTFSGGTNWKQITCNGYTLGAIKTDGTLWTWGAAFNGVLGNGTTGFNDRSTPITTFAGGNDWKQVSASESHMAAVKTDGTLWIWGSNISGELGINNTVSVVISTPVTTFAGGTNWKQVSCGGYAGGDDRGASTAAIKTDGTLWVWGYNYYGALGVGTINGKNVTPITTFAGGTNWTQVVTSTTCTIALKTDGTLWTFGYTSGLAVNDSDWIATPITTFAGGNDWKYAHRGSAIKTDGTLWTWGGNSSGQIGNGSATTTPTSTPVTTFLGGNDWRDTIRIGSSSIGLRSVDY